MRVLETSLGGVLRIQPRLFPDSRGFFFESWNAAAFAAAGIPVDFVQDNHSHSAQHTLRGLHYQVRSPQGKLVRCSAGAIYDVVVDIRPRSPSWGRWLATTLDAATNEMLWIPPGFAHGFLVLTPEADMQYKVTTPYSPADDRGIRWNDPSLGIDWPLPAGVEPRLSPKDAAAPLFESINRSELEPDAVLAEGRA